MLYILVHTLSFKGIFSEILKIPTLGRKPIQLGGLYSSISEGFLSSGKLWSEEFIERNRVIHYRPKQNLMWTSELTKSDKYDLFNFGAGGTVTIAKIEADGSFEYIYEDKVLIIKSILTLILSTWGSMFVSVFCSDF